MADALQFVVYCNCTMQLSESSKYTWKHQAQKINTDCSPTAGSYYHFTSSKTLCKQFTTAEHVYQPHARISH
jgi:hypothetical protein